MIKELLIYNSNAVPMFIKLPQPILILLKYNIIIFIIFSHTKTSLLYKH